MNRRGVLGLLGAALGIKGTVTDVPKREGVKLLFGELGVTDTEELLDKMYPLNFDRRKK